MKNIQTEKKKISIGIAVSLALHAVTLFVIIMMVHNIQILNTEAARMNKQSLQYNGRTNNLKSCFQNSDLDCPEDKYFNSRKVWEE